MKERTSVFQALDQELRESTNNPGELQRAAHKLLSLCAASELSKSFLSEIITAEVAFRSGAQEGVEFDKAAVAVNRLAERLQGPPYLFTNKEQIALFAKQLFSAMPFSFATVTKNQLSPIAAAFVSLLALHQKINNPDWQCAPDTWVENTNAELGRLRTEGRYVLRSRKTADEMVALQERFRRILKDSRIAKEFLTFITSSSKL